MRNVNRKGKEHACGNKYVLEYTIPTFKIENYGPLAKILVPVIFLIDFDFDCSINGKNDVN